MIIFLDEIYERQLTVLNYIANEESSVSIKQISENTNFSEKSIVQMIRQIEKDFPDSKKIFQLMYVQKNIEGVYVENIDVRKITAVYFRRSVLYRMIYTIFLDGYLDISKFCEAEHLSVTTFFRYRQKLVTILKDFGLSLSNENQIMGKEPRVLTFYSFFFSKSIYRDKKQKEDNKKESKLNSLRLLSLADF